MAPYPQDSEALPDKADEEELPVLHRVAILMVALGEEASGQVLKFLSDLGNMSQRVRDFIQEEMEYLGPMRLTEVEEVQLRIVQQCRQLEEQGQIVISRGRADETFV